MIKICKKCKRKFKDANATNCNARTFCSRKCANRSTMNGLKLKDKPKPSIRGELHPNWKGSDVGYVALHDWVKRRLQKPNQCQDCNKIKPLQLANLDGEYTRDIETWGYKCVSCHRLYDYHRKGIFKGSKKACKNGHEYTIENKKYSKDGNIYCRECNRIRGMKNSRR